MANKLATDFAVVDTPLQVFQTEMCGWFESKQTTVTARLALCTK